MGLTGAPGQRDRWPQPTWAVGQLQRDQDRYSEKGGHRGTEVPFTSLTSYWEAEESMVMR